MGTAAGDIPPPQSLGRAATLAPSPAGSLPAPARLARIQACGLAIPARAHALSSEDPAPGEPLLSVDWAGPTRSVARNAASSPVGGEGSFPGG